MKKILNSPERLVPEMCHGLVMAHPELDWNEKYRFVFRKKSDKKKVCLISGGGSGHEPAHAGFVGKGMLDAAICGDVFASPSQIQVYQAIRQAAGEKGVLLIIKNYSGDMMNFKNAAYLAAEDGISVKYVKVEDDIAVQDSLYTVGRRGVAGTVFVHKIAGAAAEQGRSLEEVKRIAEKTADFVRSIGFAFSSCTVPAKGTPTFTLEEDEMEYGIGIHGEPGIRREKTADADTLAKRMTDAILDELEKEGKRTDRVALLVNGMGGTPLQELYVLNHSVRKALSKRGMPVIFSLVGNYMTSIEMSGASVSLLSLDDELERLLMEPCRTPVLHIDGPTEPVLYEEIAEDTCQAEPEIELCKPSFGIVADESFSLENIIYMVHCMSDCIIRNEKEFCELDSHAGDGDFGMSVAKGFRRLKQEWRHLPVNEDIGSFLEACSLVIMEHCGGASGPIWGSAFRAAGKAAAHKAVLGKAEFARILQAAAEGIRKTGERSFGRGALVGDKTLIDALVPCADTWSAQAETDKTMTVIFEEAAAAAKEGARKTADIVARMGRAGTVGTRSLGYPDAGAHALGVIFTEISSRLTSANPYNRS